MFAELYCPYCQGNLSQKPASLTCVNCQKSFKRVGNFVIIWNINTEKNDNDKKIINTELTASREIVKALQTGKIPEDQRGGFEEFISREKGTDLASNCIEEKGFRDLVYMLPENLTELRILIIGAGTGKDAKYFNNIGVRNLVLTDIQEKFLRIAQKEVKAKYLFTANAEHLPVKSNSFDLAIFGATLHHIPNPYLALEEASRVAGMVAAYSEPSDMQELNWLIKKVGWEKDYGEVKMFRLNPSKIKRLFEKNGFKIKIKTDFIWFPLKLFKPFVNSAWFVNLYFLGLSLLDKLAGRWGHNLTFFAKKTSSS